MINDDFSFIGQTKLDPNAFASVGVRNFDTKVMLFMRASQHLAMQPYKAEEFVTMDELKQRIVAAKEIRKSLKLKLYQEASAEANAEREAFEFRLKKYLYELKAHPHLRKHYDKATALVTRFYNQKPPECCTTEERKVWEKRNSHTAKSFPSSTLTSGVKISFPGKKLPRLKQIMAFGSKAMRPGCSTG